MRLPLLTVAIGHEPDVVVARRRARQIAKLLKFADQDGTRIATAVSEIARNAFTYGGGGKVEFSIEQGARPVLAIQVSDQGPGIEDLDSILSGTYRSPMGMGLGILPRQAKGPG